MLGALCLALPASASAQLPPPFFAFEHDSSRDGQPNEIVSGFYGGNDDANDNGDPLDDRVANSYETFEFTVPPDVQAGSLNVTIQWADAQNDLDLYLYRKRPDGSIVPSNIANGATFGDTDEVASYRPPLGNVEPDTYVAVVDNWCTSIADPGASPDDCGFDEDTENEDDFTGEVRFGPALVSNPLPGVTLTGPEAGTTGQTLTFTANATDDEPIQNYAFDFNGDGRFESDNLGSNTASHRFDQPGFINVGVRVRDQDGDTAFSSRKVVISQPGSPSFRPIRTFKLNRPVFGGRKGRALKVSYRLRERSRVTLSLYRGKKRVKRLVSATRGTSRTYKVTIKPRGLRRGNYTVRMSARGTASGKRQSARLSAKRL